MRKHWGSGGAGLGVATLLASLRLGSAMAEPTAVQIDSKEFRDKLLLLTDGKSHYVAVVPPGQGDEFFYGDGKTFYALKRASSGRNDKDWDRSFVDPRFTEGGNAEGIGFLSFRGGQYKVECGPRATTLQPVDKATAKTLLDAATFERSRRKSRPYALARDDHGTYFYVDRGYHPDEAKRFRLFVGPKGNLKLQKMTNIVSDEQGDIFSTKTGSLRLILNKGESTWIKDEKKSQLTIVKVDFNVQVASIYNDFGIYAGERLGTPCDDL